MLKVGDKYIQMFSDGQFLTGEVKIISVSQGTNYVVGAQYESVSLIDTNNRLISFQHPSYQVYKLNNLLTRKQLKAVKKGKKIDLPKFECKTIKE